ncbi:hypothetical protein Tco_1291101 [Tanacetum coccineum]
MSKVKKDIHGDEKQLTDFDFEGMSYDNLRELVRKMVHSPVSSLYYCKVRKIIKQGLCRLENDVDVQEFLKTGYESKWVVDMYVEHHGNNGNFRGFINEPIPVNEDLHIEDPDSSSLEPTHQIQRGIAYPIHDPLQPWNEMQPILGMRYDHPEQLKLALANYEVAGGYQLWFQKNDWRQLLVYCESHDDANKGTDIAKISRKRTKPGQTRTRERKSTQKSWKFSTKRVYTSPSTLIGGDPRKNDTVDMKEAQGNKAYTLEVHTKEAQRLLTHGCHAGNPCALQSNPTAQIDDPMIEEEGKAKMIGSV